MRDIYISLANFYDSLNYISFYLLNPHYIVNEEWSRSLPQDYTEDTITSSSLEQNFKQDPALIEFVSMLRELQEGRKGREIITTP